MSLRYRDSSGNETIVSGLTPGGDIEAGAVMTRSGNVMTSEVYPAGNTGRYHVEFDEPMPDADYEVSLTVLNSEARFASGFILNVCDKSASGFWVSCENASVSEYTISADYTAWKTYTVQHAAQNAADIAEIKSAIPAGAGSSNKLITTTQFNNAVNPLADSVADIQDAVPADASITNQLATKTEINDRYTKTEVDAKLDDKQNALTFDITPTVGSSNPVTSAGIKTAIDAISSSNPNLLDNSWFTINQRGLTQYSGGNAYSLDRWRRSSSRSIIDLTSNGITISSSDTASTYSYVHQRVEDDLYNSLHNKTITISILYSDGHIEFSSGQVNTSVTSTTTFAQTAPYQNTWIKFEHSANEAFNNSLFIVTDYPSKSTNIRAVKLEVGQVSTLALDTAPNYQQELAKCQRYFVRLKPTTDGYASFSGLGFVFSATETRAPIDLPIPMRAIPTISKSGAIGFIGITSAGVTILNSADIQSVTLYDNVSNWHFMIGLVHATGVSPTVGTLGYIRAMNDASAYIDFSADL